MKLEIDAYADLHVMCIVEQWVSAKNLRTGKADLEQRNVKRKKVEKV